jgi:hypothetical protein
MWRKKFWRSERAAKIGMSCVAYWATMGECQEVGAYLLIMSVGEEVGLPAGAGEEVYTRGNCSWQAQNIDYHISPISISDKRIFFKSF